MTEGARFTVLIPAHDEEASIGRMLAALAPPAGRGQDVEVIVLCNGCRDATAARAAEAMPAARVVEIERPGKAHAINRGIALARHFPLIVCDADIVVNFATLDAVAGALRDGAPAVAGPRPQIDCSHASWPVRAYYRVWQRLPYVADGLGASGVYGLSEAALRNIAPLPEIIADDAYARSRFPRERRRRVEGVSRVTAPATLSALIRTEARKRAGDAELRARFPAPHPEPGNGPGALLRGALVAPLDTAVYLAIKLAGRALFGWNRLTGRHGVWLRDETSRVP